MLLVTTIKSAFKLTNDVLRSLFRERSNVVFPSMKDELLKHSMCLKAFL